MSAQPQRQPEMEQERQPRSQQRKDAVDYGSMDNRVVRLETRWEDVIPNLATKADLSDMRTEMRAGFDRMESAVREMRSDIRAEIKSDLNTQLRWVVGVMLAGFLTIVALLFNDKTPSQAMSVQQPAPVQQPTPVRSEATGISPDQSPVQPAPHEEAVRRLESGNP